MNEKLAILGGDPVLRAPLAPYRSMGEAEADAVAKVIASGCLSGFFGSPGPEFRGGATVQAFEEAWGQRYDIAHAISVNSATSGLIAAMGAVGISPGDEIIVPPFTMSATAVSPLFYGGIPVFVDIEPDTFCLDPDLVEAAITPKTRAIIAVNLFGHPAQLHVLRKLADKHGLWLIEDSAQAPLSKEYGQPCGTIGHIGIFSLNYHKHIHAGEGGVCVTNDKDLAMRLELIRNHGENCVASEGVEDLTNLVGFNFRMTELSAAVARAQLNGIDDHVSRREQLANALTEGVSNLPGLIPPVVRGGCRHNYYCWALRINQEAVGLSRDLFGQALTAEGFPNSAGYVEPLYMLPLFQNRKAIGRDGFPFTLSHRQYAKGLCPVAETMHEQELLFFEPCAYDVNPEQAELLSEAIRKVHRNAANLSREQVHAQ